MSKKIARLFLLTTVIALSGCGGGGGPTIASAGAVPPPVTPTPTPTPSPTPTPTSWPVIPAASTNTQFAALGAARGTGLQLDSASQLQVRYVASSNLYEVQLPQSQEWAAVSYLPTGGGTPVNLIAGSTHLWLWSDGYNYSRLFEWSGGGITGYEAIGLATPASGVPTAGLASYKAVIGGVTSEYQGALADDFAVDGTIDFLFDFEHGSLSGSISPRLHQGYTIDPISFRDTVYSTGSATFSGAFDVQVPGVNSFTGRFTGPAAQELIGNFAFPYRSPIDNKIYQADGAFVGTK